MPLLCVVFLAYLEIARLFQLDPQALFSAPCRARLDMAISDFQPYCDFGGIVNPISQPAGNVMQCISMRFYWTTMTPQQCFQSPEKVEVVPLSP